MKIDTASSEAESSSGWDSASLPVRRHGFHLRFHPRLLSLLALCLYLALWTSVTHDGFALISSDKYPSPRAVYDAASSLRSILLQDIAATSERVLIGLGIGICFGVGLGLLMAYSRSILYLLEPIVESMRPVPVIAMIPFFLLWFGLSEEGKILLIVLGVAMIMVVSTLEATRNVRPIYLRAAATLGANRRQIFRLIVLPGIVPELIGSLRIATAASFTLVVAAEFMGAQNGLGFLISEAQRLFEPNVIMLGVLLFGVMAGIVDQVVRRVGGYVTRWSERPGR